MAVLKYQKNECILLKYLQDTSASQHGWKFSSAFCFLKKIPGFLWEKLYCVKNEEELFFQSKISFQENITDYTNNSGYFLLGEDWHTAKTAQRLFHVYSQTSTTGLRFLTFAKHRLQSSPGPLHGAVSLLCNAEQRAEGTDFFLKVWHAKSLGDFFTHFFSFLWFNLTATIHHQLK